MALKRPFTAYSGAEPHVFVCYSHADAQSVYAQISRLHDAGINIWYDEGIEVGQEWRSEIADALNQAYSVLFFQSRSSAASKHCTRELGYALDHDIPVLRVDLDGADLPHGLQLGLQGEQAITPKQHPPDVYEAKLLSALEPPGRGSITQREVASLATRSRERDDRRWQRAAGIVGVAVGLVGAVIGVAVALWMLTPSVEEGRSAPEPTMLALPANQAAVDHYVKARSLLRQRDVRQDSIEDAISEFAAATRVDPKFVQAHAGSCVAHLFLFNRSRDTADFERAEAACFRASELLEPGTSSWEVQYALGERHLAAGQPSKAVDMLESANRLHPNNAEILVALGEALTASGQFERGEGRMREAILEDPSSWSARVALASALYDSQRYEETVDLYGQFLELAPDHAGALVGLGSALFMLDRREEATAVWERAAAIIPVSQRPRLATLYSNLGLRYYYDGAFEQAIESHRETTRLVPENHLYWGRLAEALRGAKRLVEQREAYEAAIELAERELTLNPDNWETLGLLAIYHGFSDQPAVARDYALRAEAAAPTEPTAAYFAALAYWSSGDTEAAYAALTRASQLGFSPELLREDPDLKDLRELDADRFDAAVEVIAGPR